MRRPRVPLSATAFAALLLPLLPALSPPPSGPAQARGVAPAPAAAGAPKADLADLGEKLFFDARLSRPPGQSCAACHAPEVGWTGPD